MRTTTLLLTLSLAAAALAFLPAAEARADSCTAVTGGCDGFVCVDQNGDRRFSNNECVGRDDVDLDLCRFQSDCCSTFGGLWCPDRE